MSDHRVLGDNPFEPAPPTEPAAPAPPAAEQPPDPSKKRVHSKPRAQPAAKARRPVPDIETEPLGAEAAPHPAADHPPPPEYGRSLVHEVRQEAARRGLVYEFRLVERWVRERIQPEPPAGGRRRLPLEFLWR